MDDRDMLCFNQEAEPAPLTESKEAS